MPLSYDSLLTPTCVCVGTLQILHLPISHAYFDSGLAPHCLAILKTCHVLSEKLVGMTMQGNTTELSSPETMTDLVATAKRISPRVDDVVKSLYPPLDPRLLEAR